MKNFSLLLISFVCITFCGKAQSFDENYVVWSAGYGLGSWWDAIASSAESNSAVTEFRKSSTGPLYGKIEFGLSDEQGIGVNLAWVGRSYTYNYRGYSSASGSDTSYLEKQDYSSFSFLLRYNRHFSDNDKVDAYWGVGIGYRSDNYTYSSNDPNNGTNHLEFNSIFPLGFDATLGVRFYFTPRLGLYVETGFAKSVIQFGLVGTIGNN